MGEIADGIIKGELCKHCHCYIGSPVGFPRSCDSCQEYHENVAENH